MIKTKIYKNMNTKTKTQTNIKCFKDKMYVIFLKSMGCWGMSGWWTWWS